MQLGEDWCEERNMDLQSRRSHMYVAQPKPSRQVVRKTDPRKIGRIRQTATKATSHKAFRA